MTQNRSNAKESDTRVFQAIESLSGGVAHSLNNYLMAIRSSLEMIRLKNREDVEHCIAAANEAIERAENLAQHLLSIAGKSHLNRSPISANQLVQRIAASVPTGPSVEISVDPSNPLLNVDEDAMFRAMKYIVDNALDAIRNHGGVIRVEVTSITHPAIGDAVRLRVSDDGIGMSEETQRSVFDPFSTTKGVGEGLGLGLAIARGIVSQHQGLIEVSSSLGEGAVFCVTLPHATGLQSLARPLRILLVDGAPAALESGRSRIAKIGHEVSCVSNGSEAISRIAHDGPFDVVIIDSDLPEVSGVDTMLEIRSAWRDQPIVFCRDISDPAIQDDKKHLESIPIGQRPPVVQKPFDMENLQQVLLDVLAVQDDKS